jgi:hypothetical protein
MPFPPYPPCSLSCPLLGLLQRLHMRSCGSIASHCSRRGTLTTLHVTKCPIKGGSSERKTATPGDFCEPLQGYEPELVIEVPSSNPTKSALPSIKPTIVRDSRKESSQGAFTAGMGAVGSNLDGLLLIDATAMVAITRTTMPRMTMFHMNTVSIRNCAVGL